MVKSQNFGNTANQTEGLHSPGEDISGRGNDLKAGQILSINSDSSSLVVNGDNNGLK